MLWKPETEKSNMATRGLFWKWHCWESIDSFPYTQVMSQWSWDLIFKAKVMLESGNRKIQYACLAAILNVTSLKIKRLQPIATNNMHVRFEIEILKQTRVMLRKPCRLQTDGRTGGRRNKVNPAYSPPTSLIGGMINIHEQINMARPCCNSNLFPWMFNCQYFMIVSLNTIISSVTILNVSVNYL